MEILDSHFHLYTMKKFNLDVTLDDNLIGIDVGTDPFDYIERKELIRGRFDYSHAAGPWCVSRDGYKGAAKTARDVEICFESYKGTFLGEIGLDYYRMYGTKEEQIKLFNAQLDLAESLGLPVIIHSRDADEDMAREIKKRRFKNSGIIHCFSSDVKMMETALEQNLYISFAGTVTYKTNIKVQEAARSAPISRILYETDSPYLAPEPLRGKACRPEYTEYTSAFLAELRNEDVNDFRKSVISNFRTLKSLSEGSLL